MVQLENIVKSQLSCLNAWFTMDYVDFLQIVSFQSWDSHGQAENAPNDGYCDGDNLEINTILWGWSSVRCTSLIHFGLGRRMNAFAKRNPNGGVAEGVSRSITGKKLIQPSQSDRSSLWYTEKKKHFVYLCLVKCGKELIASYRNYQNGIS